MPNTPDIDVSALAEALNEKMDRDMYNKATNIHYIVETWHSGTEWYRVWSDGWIEQGGVVSRTASLLQINLNTPFTSTNYVVQATMGETTASTKNVSGLIVGTQTTSSFYVGNDNSAFGNWNWYACGF